MKTEILAEKTKIKAHAHAHTNRIETNPKILAGKPIIKGTRIPVSLILNLLAHDYTIDRILEAYPNLRKTDVLAAIRYSELRMDNEKIVPFEFAR